MWEAALLKAIQQFDSMQQFSEKLGVPRENVSAWLNRNIQIPVEYAFLIENLTEGKISWKELVPHHTVRLLRSVSFSVGPIIDHPYIQVHVSIHQIHPSKINQPLLSKGDITKSKIYLCVDEENHIIFGEEIFYYYQNLGKKTVPVWRISLPKLLMGYYPSDALVLTFTLCERAAIGMALENFLGSRQGQRIDLLKNKLKRNSRHTLVENFPQVLIKKGTKTRDFLSKRLGFKNSKTYEQTKKIYIKGCPELREQVNQKKLAISRAVNLAILSYEKKKN